MNELEDLDDNELIKLKQRFIDKYSDANDGIKYILSYDECMESINKEINKRIELTELYENFTR